MQAHKGEAVQQKGIGGRYVVVKAVVDQATQRAALLLADSSCLLVSLSGRSAVVPITVPAPCSDACFLHLQAYAPAGASSSTSGFGHKFGNGLSPSPTKVGFGDVLEKGALKIGQGESHVSWVQEPWEKESAGNLSGGNGRAKGQGFGGSRKEFFVVTARPALGGSCTDLRAWSCADSSFASVDIEFELGDKRVRYRDELHNIPRSRTLARLDAPHGLAVKLAASINVLVVYSSSAGKFWVIAGKWSNQTGGPAQSVMGKDVFGAEGPARKRLVLMKCAVVRCHGPVYSLHVSPLHLFLGESKGVRVWSLRPLIKPGSSGNSSGQSKPRLHATPEQGLHQFFSTLACERCACGDRCQHVMEPSSASGRINEKMCNGNGAKLDANVDLRDNMGVAAMKKLPRKGLFSTGELDVGANFAGIGNYRKPQFGSGGHFRVSCLEFWSLSQLQEALKSDCLENLFAEDDVAGKTTMGSDERGVVKIETRNGASRSCPAEHGGVPIKELFSVTKSCGPQGHSITSTPEACPSNEHTGNCHLKNSSGPRAGLTAVSESHLVASLLGAQPVASQLAIKKTFQHSGPSVHATGSRVQSRISLDSAGMWFVALGGKESVVTTQCTSHAGPQLSPQLQVVDMQGLSLKEYVILDSMGELHLLTLHDVSEERKLVSMFPTLRHLQITTHVTSFAVLPLPPPLPQAHRDFVSPAAVTAKRKLWISDGMYSVHVLILPEKKTKGSIDSTTTQGTLAVSQVVFVKDRVDGLVAGSSDTIVVLTKGKLVSYVIPRG